MVVSVGGEGGPGRRRSTASGVVVMWERIIVWECTTGAIIYRRPGFNCEYLLNANCDVRNQ